MKEEKVLLFFGKHLKKLRLQQKISQEQLALLAELDRTYISGIERGKRNVSLLNLFKLAKSLDISVSELICFKIEEYESSEK